MQLINSTRLQSLFASWLFGTQNAFCSKNNVINGAQGAPAPRIATGTFVPSSRHPQRRGDTCSYLGVPATSQQTQMGDTLTSHLAFGSLELEKHGSYLSHEAANGRGRYKCPDRITALMWSLCPKVHGFSSSGCAQVQLGERAWSG